MSGIEYSPQGFFENSQQEVTVMEMSSGKRHKPCKFNPDGATREYCTEVSEVAARQMQGCNACTSPFKAKTRSVPYRAYGNTSDRLIAMDEARIKPRVVQDKPLAHSALRHAAQPAKISSVAEPASPIEKAATLVQVPSLPATGGGSAQRQAIVPVSPVRQASVPAVIAERRPVVARSVTPLIRQQSPSPKESWRLIMHKIQIAIANSIFVKLPPWRIRPMVGQPRSDFEEGALSRLEASMREVGQLQPGMVRRIPQEGDITHELLDGERRWRISGRINAPEYRAMELEIADDAAPFIVASMANFNRAGHTPLEILKAIDKLHNQLGIPIPAIAHMHGITTNWGYRLEGLLKLKPEVRDLLDPNIMGKKKCLSIVAAMHISSAKPEEQEEFAKLYLGGKITVRELAARVSEGKERTAFARPKKPFHEYTAFVARGRSIGTMATELSVMCERTDLSSIVRNRDRAKIEEMARALQKAEALIPACRAAIEKLLG